MKHNISTRLSLGFIGGGLDSAIGNVHRIASSMDNRFSLVAGCFSEDPQINSKTADLWKIDASRTYMDWQTMLHEEKGRLDAVSIITPIHLHYEMVTQALKLGYSVICEKPIADSSCKAKNIIALTEKGNQFLVVPYNYTGYPMVRELKNMIDQNILGSIFQIQVEMPQEAMMIFDEDNQRPVIPKKWRLQDFENVAMISLDLGSHLYNLIYFLTESRPLEVFATARNCGHFEVVDNVSLISKWEKNIECNIWYSKSALGHSNGLKIQVFGDRGSVEWYQMEPEFLHYADCSGKKSIYDRKNSITGLPAQERYNRFKAGHPHGFIEAFANYYYDIADCLWSYQQNNTYHSPFVCKTNTLETEIRFLEAITESAKTKSLIQL